MSAKNNTVVSLHAAPSDGSGQPRAAQLFAISDDGRLWVRESDGAEYACWWLETATNAAPVLAIGDPLLVVPPQGNEADASGVAMGRIGPYRAPAPQKQLVLEATEVLRLKCGDVSIDLRAADGKLMLRGEDVLMRARGSQRIKAGSVNIN